MKLLSLINLPIALAGFLLISIGILVIYSSSRDLAIQQSIFAAVGLILFFFVSQIELDSTKKLITPLYFFILLLLIFVMFLGFETRGAVRWIPLGIFNIQPSEIAKPFLVLFLAKFWSEHPASWKNIFKSLFWVIPAIVLIFEQPDLGSSLTISAIWLGILFGFISAKKIIIILLVILLMLPVSWIFLHDYQKGRISSFLSPERDPLGRGYNLIQSTIAVGSGEIIGRGLGQGTQSRLQFLPEFRTDFIFASIAEEMGFIGSSIVITIYFFLFMYCLMLARETNGIFNFLNIIGVFSMLSFQTVVNIGMNIGLLPITGITLPLISYGGSSMIATFLSLGIVAAVGKFRKRVDPGKFQAEI